MKANRQIAVNGHKTAFPPAIVSEPPNEGAILPELSGWFSPSAREAVAIAIVLLLAASFRLIRIASQPPGLFQDEAVNGVNVYTILGGSPRFYFGEREPLFMYLSAFVSLLLGTTPLALRVTAAFVGIFNAAAVGALGRQLFGKTVGLLAAAGVATSLWLTILSRVSFRATMVPGVECLGLALLWRATRTRRLRDYAIGGGVLAVSFYTYLAARFIPFALVAFVLVCAVTHWSWLRQQLLGLIVAAIAALGVCLPLGYYGMRHPEVIFGRPDQVALPEGAAYLPALVDSTVRTLGMILVRGDSTWRHNFGGMPVFDPVSGVAFLIGLVVALRRHRPADLLAIVFFFVMLGPGMLSIDSPHYLRTIGAAGGLYLLWAVGISTIAQAVRRLAWRLSRGGGSARLAALATVLVVAFGVTIAAARTGWLYFAVYPRQVEVGAAFNVDLAAAGQFLASAPLWHTSRADVYVTDKYEIDRASVAYFLYPYLNPTEQAQWLDPPNVGTFFAQDELIPLPIAPSLYVIAGDDRTTLAALGNTVTRTQWVRPGADRPVLAVWAQPGAQSSPAPIAQFGQLLALERAGAEPVTANTDGKTTTTVSLRWRVLGKPSYLPSIFVHLEDSRGHLIAQADVETKLLLDQWRPGQELVSEHVVQLPPGTPPATYTLVVGVYDRASGNREAASMSGHPVATVVAHTVAVIQPVGGVAAVDRRLDAALAPGLTLVGADRVPPDVEAGATIPVSLLWRATDTSRVDEDAVLSLFDVNGTVVGQLREPIGGGDFVTSRWTAGAIVRQAYDVPVLATAKGVVSLRVTAQRAGTPLDAATAIGWREIGQLTVNASTHQFSSPNPRHALDLTFAGAGKLIGYDLGTATARPGDQLQVTLYWQASGPSDAPYTVFVHVLDASNKVVAQRDEPPSRGTRPTTGWVPGEYIQDEHLISLDATTTPGADRLEVGLYDARTGQRVGVTPGGDSAIIGTLAVVSP